MQNFKKFSPWAWMGIRHCLLNYFQANKTRVTIFLKKEVQDHTTGCFHLDLRRPLPEGISLPQLKSNHQKQDGPYDSAHVGQAKPEKIILLGSNMFNEIKKAQPRPKTSHTLEGLLVRRTTEKELSPASERDLVDDPHLFSGTQWESLQLQMMTADRPETAKPVVEEESLLDLFDEATHLLDE